MSARERLARAQAELARALALGAPVPEGFNAERVQAAADSLLAKRRRQVQRVWPVLAAALGEEYAARFNAWARESPLPLEASALVDGRRFAEALRVHGVLPAEARAAVWEFDFRWRLTPEGGVERRRGLGVSLGRNAKGQRVLALRLPGGRTVYVPSPRGRGGMRNPFHL